MPTSESLRTATLRHRFGDLFNPPGLTNFLGSAQVALDPTGLTSISFPPLSMGESSAFGESGSVATGVLFVDGEYALARGRRVEFSTAPDRVDRRVVVRDLEIRSTTLLPMGESAVIEKITVTNTSAVRRRHRVSLGLHGTVTAVTEAWAAPQAPAEFDNSATVDVAASTVEFRSQHAPATVVQGSWPPADVVDASALHYDLDLAPGESREFTFAVAVDSDAAQARVTHERLVHDFDAHAKRARDEWDATLAAAFTPDNNRFSGHLPRLETDDPDLLRLYHTAVWTLLFHQRQVPHAAHTSTYTTLGPRYWQTTTFLWDISLAAPLLAQLDPTGLRTMMERWMDLDVHQHFGTEYVTGKGVGPWYSVNDYAMCRMAGEYLSWSGDDAWLDTVVAGKSVLDHLVNYATSWRARDVNGHGLADYGGVNNLLEAVGSYVHEVAGMNAANVANLRFVADLLDGRSRAAEAGQLRREAGRLVRQVQGLYVAGGGFWRCQSPDGSTREVRHCYDFATVLTTIPDDLSATQKREMVGFFKRELKTPRWMRALSAKDPDVTFSVRPDHQWTGAYAAWPSISLMALFNAGESTLAIEWMRGLGQTMRQGPVAQAYFAEDVIPRDGGGARKAPSDPPWINDWSCVAGAAYAEPVIAGLFGVRPPLRGVLRARPQLSGALASARLTGLRWQGRSYDVDAKGLHPAAGKGVKHQSERTL